MHPCARERQTRVYFRALEKESPSFPSFYHFKSMMSTFFCSKLLLYYFTFVSTPSLPSGSLSSRLFSYSAGVIGDREQRNTDARQSKPVCEARMCRHTCCVLHLCFHRCASVPELPPHSKGSLDNNGHMKPNWSNRYKLSSPCLSSVLWNLNS